MGNYLTPGHTFTDGQTVTGPSLTEHVGESTFKTTAITTQTLKTPAALTDQLLVVASDVFYQETLQQIHDLILYPGSVVQTVYGEYTANTNLTTIIPFDDTIPQNTEGTEIINLSITPRFASSLILASFYGSFGCASINTSTCALFRDANVGAIAIGVGEIYVAGGDGNFALVYQDSPATTNATAYKIRVGPSSAATIRMNGRASTRIGGGTLRTTLVLQEIKV